VKLLAILVALAVALVLVQHIALTITVLWAGYCLAMLGLWVHDVVLRVTHKIRRGARPC
jgi:hypothetical protein